jgi:hypothetical protein
VAVSGTASDTLTIEVRVSRSSDDAEEHLDDNTVDVGSSDLEMIYDDWYSGNGFDQEVGMRFQDVDVPVGATIVSAYIEFVADASDGGDGASALTIYGQAADNPDTFAETDGDITGRTKTTASAAWNPGEWDSEQTYQTSDLTTIVQEIVDRDGWSSGNAMAFIVTGASGDQVRAESHDGSSADAPLLVIEYSGGHINYAPDQPTLLQPSDGATDVSTSPTLEVTVTDPNITDTLAVTFYGRQVDTGSSVGEDFTIIALPDTQAYSDDNPVTRAGGWHPL